MKIIGHHLANNRAGFTLVEVMIAMAILVIIAVTALNLYVFSASVTSQSETKLDATYLAQTIMEEKYAESKTADTIPESPINSFYQRDGYWVDETIAKVPDSLNLVRVLVKVYADEHRTQLEAQMETYLLWNPVQSEEGASP